MKEEVDNNNINNVNVDMGHRNCSKNNKNSPIIIVLNINDKSIISLINITDILKDNVYIGSEDKIKIADVTVYPKEVYISKELDNTIIYYKVVDNYENFKDNDWSRVVAVFVDADYDEWDFENIKNVPKFFIRFDTFLCAKNIRECNDLNIITICRYNRNLDKFHLKEIWLIIENFIKMNKPYLLYK
uniref:CDC73_C domain-containing protein n=1 Tax=Strongyloides stercoralis TaxID=6248 RepID=A0A0K0E5A2_STRER